MTRSEFNMAFSTVIAEEFADVPDESEIEVEFSDEFNRKMQELIDSIGANNGQQPKNDRKSRLNIKGLIALAATFDELNKYFTISNMPIASSQYWNSIHGRVKGEAELDEEGKQTMRTLARNMAFLMKSIALGREKYGLPEKEPRVATNFIG